jgi:predicted enzyme related to lactoylglutathione lyase
MLNLNSIMIGTMQPAVMAEFYEKMFNKPADMVEGTWHGWSVGSTFFSIGEHSEAKGKAKDPVRIIANFETTEVKEEFARIKEIKGAEVIKEPYEMQGAWIATLADPDGNYFQLMTPWDDVKNEKK